MMKLIKLKSPSLLALVLLLAPSSTTIHAQHATFTIAGIRPFDKAVPGQVMEVLFAGLGSGAAPMMIPETEFSVAVSQDGITQQAKVRIAKFTMLREIDPKSSNKNAVDFSGIKMIPYHAVSFVVPSGLRPGPAEVVASYKGRKGNAVALEIVEKPLPPLVGTTSVVAVSGISPQRTGEMKLAGNDLGWRLERGTTVNVFVNPLVDPDDPNSAVLIRFKQDGSDHDAVTRIASTGSKVADRNGGVAFFAAREQLEVDVPATLSLGQAQVEIRLQANGQVSDPVNLTATITDVTRVAEAPAVSAPRVLAVTPRRVGAGQALMISVDQRRTLEPEPKETKVVIEQDNARYFASIEQNSALVAATKAPDAPVGMFVRTTRELIGRVQLRVLNSLRGEQLGLSAPVPLEIVDEVLPPELTGVAEAGDADLAQLKQLHQLAKDAGKEFSAYDPGRRYLAAKVRDIDYNPGFVRVTLEQADKKITLTRNDFSSYSDGGLIVKLPEGLTAGEVKFTIENFGGDERYSKPVSKTFMLRAGT